MTNNNPLRCYCGLDLFLDDDGSWSCPARFDGEHSIDRQQEWNVKQQRQQQISQMRTAAGAVGGRNRAQHLSAADRASIARNAAQSRWNKKLGVDRDD